MIILVSLSSCGAINDIAAEQKNVFYQNVKFIPHLKWPITKDKTKLYDYNDENIQYLNENGYILVGYNALRTTYIGYRQAEACGTSIGAAITLYKHIYQGTSTGTAVVPIYKQGETYIVRSSTTAAMTSNTSSNGTISRPSGNTYVQSNTNSQSNIKSNTVTAIQGPSSFTYYTIPYTQDIYDQYALYYVKKFYKNTFEINVYKAANYKSPKIFVMPSNYSFELLGKGKDFCIIRYDGKIGYVTSTSISN